jgi:NAD(P)H-hydrate epimerase
MKIFTTSQVKLLDSYTIVNEPITSIDLMERASSSLFETLIKQFSASEVFLFFIGPGNNGGDGLALARMLSCVGKRISVFLLSPLEQLSPDSLVNYMRLSKVVGLSIVMMKDRADLPLISEDAIVVDALLGSGLTRPVKGFAKEVIQHINGAHSTVLSIDIPSGLPGEDCNSFPDDSIVRATYTYTLQFPKISFFFPENEKFVGEIVVVPIGLHPDGIASTATSYTYLLMGDLSQMIPSRPIFGHKGTFGHLLAIAGSKGMMGASLLVGKGAYRAGVGLVTCHVPLDQGAVLQIGLPEALVDEDASPEYFTKFSDIDRCSAVVVGPGIGQSQDTAKAVEQLFRTVSVPLVIDADAINLMAMYPKLQKLLPENAILTPHPKELERLLGKWNHTYERIERQRTFAVDHKVVLLCKGKYTTIALPSGDIIFNSTGNSGMATGGSGDALSGIIGGLLAQGIDPAEAASIGVFLHGLAGDIAASKVSEHGMMASDIINHLGDAWLKVIGA